MSKSANYPASPYQRPNSRLASLRLTAHRLWWQLSSPATIRVLRRVLITLAVMWIGWSFLRTFTGLFSTSAIPSRAVREAVPLTDPAPAAPSREIDIDEMSRWPLFGRISADTGAGDGALEESPALADDVALGRIEEDAEETRLPLLLVGLFSTADFTLDRAVIETAQTQAQYSLGDELPLSGRVSIAKILADRVVIDNDGSYELLRLFDDSDRIASLGSQARTAADATDAARQAALDARNQRIRQLASAHRRGAGTGPATLANVINIEAATDDGVLAGYRVSPARDAARMEALGFRDGDIITSIDGARLDDPSRGAVLNRALRSGRNAHYGILRDGAELSLTVGGSGALAQ